MLTLRERQPLGVTAEPKSPCPWRPPSIPAGEGAVFAPPAAADRYPGRTLRRPGRDADRAGDGEPRADHPFGGGQAGLDRQRPEPVRAAPCPPPPWGIFSGQGAPEAATVDARGVLRLWSLAPDRIAPGPEALGYTLGDGEADLAGTVPAEGGTDLALPVAGMPVVAVVTARGPARGTLRERLRITLPAPAGTGIATLGEGAALRLVVGLGDGRVAAVALEGGQP